LFDHSKNTHPKEKRKIINEKQKQQNENLQQKNNRV
jgi:hypothetical protein